jgi:isocitrate/isopropylmalate dehydrogenase
MSNSVAKSRNYKVASIPADGIGPEVVSAAIEVVQKLAEISKTFTIEFQHIPWGTAYYKQHGKYVEDNVLEVLRRYNAILFGSVGAPGKVVLITIDFPIIDLRYRCSRSYISVGPFAGYPWTAAVVCQCSTGADISWDVLASSGYQVRSSRYRLGSGTRKHRR